MDKLRKSLPPLSTLLPFEAAARLESVTKAGAELGLTQAAVSRQIRALEEDLGTQLFDRRNRAIHLTEEGREFGRIVSGAFESIGSLASHFRRERNDGEVVLFSQLCEGLYWLMPRLSNFYQTHPNIQVRVTVSTKPLTEAVERFDLALQTTNRKSGNAPLAFSVADEVFPVCSPKYLEGKQVPLPLSTLSENRLLHHKAYPQDWIDWDDWLMQLGLPVRVGYEGVVHDSYPMMMQAVLEGHGIALGWRRTTEQLLQTGALVRPFSESVPLPDGLSVYQRPGGQSGLNTLVLLDWIKSEFND